MNTTGLPSACEQLGTPRPDWRCVYRLYKQVCMECASVTRGPDGGLQTREVQGDVVEEVTHLPQPRFQ